MGIVKKIYQCFLLTFFSASTIAQNVDVATFSANPLMQAVKDSSARVAIQQIIIKGNKKTRAYIILREIHIHAGDTLSIASLNAELQKAKQQVYNTNLFNEVRVEPIVVSAGAISLEVNVRERLYIFPLPKFQLVDRNINEWLRKSKADFGRVIYGIRLNVFNLTGRKDHLKFTLLNGFTQNYAFSYTLPYINKKLTNGISVGAGYIRNKDFIYKTAQDNKPIFFNNGQFSRQNTFVNLGYIIRKNILGTQTVTLSYNHVSVADSLIDIKYNPNFFKTPVTAINYVDLSYTFQYVNTNNVIYPLKGTTGFARVFKRGLGFDKGVDMFFVEGAYNKYWDLHKGWYASAELNGKCTLPFDQSYINQKALGYSDVNLRGLELYVIDGVAMGLLRSTLKKKVVSFIIPMPFKSKQFGKIPFTIFAKTYADFGYVYNKEKYQTNLNNKLLYTGGFGMDILTLFDVNLRVQYSFNQLGKNGLFLQPYSAL